MLNQAPDLCEKHGPCEKQHYDGRNRLLAEDADAGLEADGVVLGNEGNLESGFHAEDGFEESAFGDGDVNAAAHKVVAVDFVAFEGEILTYTVGNGGYERGIGGESGFGVECSHGYRQRS